MDVPAQEERANSPFLQPCVPLRPTGGCTTPTLARGPFLTPSTDSNAALFQKHPHRPIQNHVLPATGAPLRTVKLTPEISHHSSFKSLPSQVVRFLKREMGTALPLPTSPGAADRIAGACL